MDRKLFVFPVALAFVGSAFALDPRVAELTAELDSLRSSFTQRVVDEAGRVIEDSAGTFALQAPNLFRWHYETPYEQLIVADGQQVWMYDVELEQVTVKNQDQAAASSPLYLLTRPESLEERYEVEYLEVDDRQTVLLRPRATEAEFEWVEVRFEEGRLSGLLIQDGFGQQTLIELQDVCTNLELPLGLFRFVPPEGIDVLGTDELLTETFARPEE